MNSHRYRTVVQRHHVRRREILIVAGTLALAAVLGLGFYLGQRAAYSGMGINPASYHELQVAVPGAEQQMGQLEHELGVSSTRNAVDKASLELVRQEITSQKEKILDLEERLRFYQGLIAPDDVARGLVLRPIEILATETDNRFTYRIVVQQEAQKHGILKGTLVVKVSGTAGGDELTFPLSALSEDIDRESVDLRFRYFQPIEGVLILPPGFEPQGISVVAKSSTPTKSEVQEYFPWSVKERYSYVGK